MDASGRPPSQDEQAQFEALQDKIFADFGFDCRQYKSNYLKRRLAVRMRALGLRDYRDYGKVLDRDPSEYPKLKDRITINVTEFFRDPEMYSFLEKEVLPALVERKRREAAGRPWTLNAWSAGCSSGEEPYSLGILLAERFRGAAPGEAFRVLATDIDQACLARAREGLYDRKSVEGLSAERGRSFFWPRGEGLAVSEALRPSLRFQAHDLFSDPAPGKFDLILCRNVMIYFSKDQHQRLFEMFHQALRPLGCLVIGKTETMLGRMRDFFSCLSSRERVYQRVD